MNSLTVALASLGGIVLAGVVAHGAWQARRAGPQARRPGEREEPSASAPRDRRCVRARRGRRAASTTATAPATAALEAAAAAARRADRRARARSPSRRRSPATSVIAHLPSKRHVGSKLVIVEGLEQPRPASGKRRPRRQRYGELQAGVQLANRTGALNEIEYSEFVQRMQAFADADRRDGLDSPDMLDVMARARELDAFASQHDAQLAVHLHARGAAWSVGYIQQHARRHGFVPGVVPGRLVYPSTEEGAPPVLDADLRLAGRARRRARSRRGARRHARLRRAADRPRRSSRSRPGRRRRRRSRSAWTPTSSTTTAGRSAAPGSRRSAASSGAALRARSRARSRRRHAGGAAPVQLRRASHGAARSRSASSCR